MRFYSDVLGLELVRAQRDATDPDTRTYYFDLGGGALLALFEYVDARSTIGGVGGLHHLSLRVAPDALDRVRGELAQRGVAVTDIDEQPFFRSVYFRDPDGVQIEVCASTRALGPADLHADPDPVPALAGRLAGGTGGNT